ncbi:type VI secretion system Vgr family protein [Erythrobacter sp. EC-HK427]|uniref:type VI secretion system Vgr family protein n=1 Tax=Erythrobacter sp. EC-HK427 TaxID=2038396 RepID=UPI00125A751C|nr:type VI secretion system tip protein TssI/VgrG [Erythrobacter sp. EC-HK427]VVT17952.1 Type VI secretion system secreted protein VgrG [Erythrobacter sp. EC-HK427]
MTHLLNIRALGDENVEDYALYRFSGREAISESFLYEVELFTDTDPDCSKLIGKLCEFDVTQGSAEPRIFAGRIYAARKTRQGGSHFVTVQVRPAYHALSYARDTHFVQDKSSIDIFEAMTKDLTGFVKSVQASPSPQPRAYSVRLDEYENRFLDRLLSHDGLMYFFVYERGAGAFRHKMIVSNQPSAYIDVPGGAVEFRPQSDKAAINHLERNYAAKPQSQDVATFSSINSETVKPGSEAMPDFAKVYAHETKAFIDEEGDNSAQKKAFKERHAQEADYIEGRSDEPHLFAGGRVEIKEANGLVPNKVVLTAVMHSAEDPWMFDADRPGQYSNSFTAIDANLTFRPAVDEPQRVAPGPFLGVIGDEQGVTGESHVDDKHRVPVLIDGARDYSGQGLNKAVWLPVRQQWGAGGTHGSQFLPRGGTRVVVNFLHGDPDLPYIDGVLYSPGNKYPHPHAESGLKSGWRSVTNKDGGVTQEFFFEDKEGEERIWLYTDRNYEREVQKDELGHIFNDQAIEIENDQRLTVHNNREVQIDVNQVTNVDGERQTTVTGKSSHESVQEILLTVGPSSIKLTPSGIEITAPTIKIDASATLDMSAGASATLGAPMTEVSGDGMLTLKGGMVMIN